MDKITVKVENEDTIPRQTAYLEFSGADELLDFLHDSEVYRSFSVDTVGRPTDLTWLVRIWANAGWLEMCKDDGVCGICGASVDPEQPEPDFGPGTMEPGVVYCAHCGRAIARKREKSISDLFHENTRKLTVEYPVEPIPAECGECGGSGVFEPRDRLGRPAGEARPCGECGGSGKIRVPSNLLML